MIPQSKPLTTLKEVQDVYNFFFASDGSPLMLWCSWEFTGPKRYGASKTGKPLEAPDYACYPAMMLSANRLVAVPYVVANKKATVRLHFHVNGFKYIETTIDFGGKNDVTALEVFNKVMDGLTTEASSDNAPAPKGPPPQNSTSDGIDIPYKNFVYHVSKLPNGDYIVKNTDKGNMELANGTRKKALINLYNEKINAK